MEENRKKLYDFLKNKKIITTTKYDEWKNKYFSSDSGVEQAFTFLKGKKYFTNLLKDFYVKYVCDLSWAKNNQYCRTTTPTPNPPQTGWNNFPCVPQLATQKGISIKSDGSYTIDGFTYYGNGRKYESATRKMSSYTCNDAEFQSNSSNTNNGNRSTTTTTTGTGLHYTPCPETLPIKRYCKNETIKKIQKCIGVKDDGKFGPITQEALESLDLPGTRITVDSLVKACGDNALNTRGIQGTQNTQGVQNAQGSQVVQNTQRVRDTQNPKSAYYYSDYQTDEYETEPTNSNPYGDYGAVEDEGESTISTPQSVETPVTSSTPPTTGEPIDIELTPKQKATNAYMYGQPNK